MQENCVQANPHVDSKAEPTTDVNHVDLAANLLATPRDKRARAFVRFLALSKLEGAQERQKHLFFGF